MLRLTIAIGAALGAGCASQQDHFYTLNPVPDITNPQRLALNTHVLLDVMVPSVVDRSEMVINQSPDGILVLDHQRWAAPFVDEVSQTLSRDIEGRRPDVLVASRGFDQANTARVQMKVEVVRVTVSKGGTASFEAHWRVNDARAGTDQIGSDVFSARLDSGDYSAIARAFSICLGALADRLVAQLPPA